jgi:hypothetical protein
MKHITEKQAARLPHGTKLVWMRGAEELDNGLLIHDITNSFIDWSDGQRTYTYNDAAMKYVFMPSAEGKLK